ncbi:phage tail protein [Dyadobacter fermentans]|uniref:Tail Collar domain protein n=1 Tax=Dyadobacter fermentans (strain ATCC 700827 / DSM 18053 / CIP 107007 / KCTC 52180 / NS114) TaxID=471854 RepID=C6W6X7_DYAFD|nr:tail fiber protein [Dyadobacter fermentans]ACT92586.1 Tail Collar domain protein [Dyadobacter fermentans DSM 18053]
MADQFVAEIRIFPFNFPPTGWAFCNGQIMPISQNTALFSLLGTYYGGDGKSTFALPDLQGSAPMHQGDGPGLSNRSLGEQSGSPSVTLIQTEIPVHTHNLNSVGAIADSKDPNGTCFGVSQNGNVYTASAGPSVIMQPTALSTAGATLPHNNMMPYLTVNFCIALQGIFPQRG